jgi:transposase
MVKRCELSDAQWQRIEALLPAKAGDPGRTANTTPVRAHRQAATGKGGTRLWGVLEEH